MPALACPRCETQLNKQADGRLACAACQVNFPVLDEVPLMWPEPGATLLDWRNRFNAALAEIEQQQAATNSPSQALPTTSIQRLQQLHQAYARYHQEVNALLAPLRVGEALATETHLALKTRLPSHHGVLSYAQNIHRDWCWGETENRQVFEHLASALHAAAPGPLNEGAVLVLGCGAGRLAYDLHNHLKPRQSWALDSNPLLCLVGSRVSQGEALTLTEFPLAPVDLQQVAVERTLAAPVRTAANLHFVCADALSPPFAPAAFDLVVTPWLLDVIDASVADCLRIIRRVLKPGGTWLQHGSVAFGGARPEHRLTRDELAEVSAAHGFEVVSQQDTQLPYMQSPASRQRRHELTYTQIAVRNNQAVDNQRTQPQRLPEWLIEGRQPVPLSPAFQTQITTVRIHSFIMSLIDGKRSVRDMAKVLEEQRLMPAQQAEQAIRGFLTTMYEEATHRDGLANRQ